MHNSGENKTQVNYLVVKKGILKSVMTVKKSLGRE